MYESLSFLHRQCLIELFVLCQFKVKWWSCLTFKLRYLSFIEDSFSFPWIVHWYSLFTFCLLFVDLFNLKELLQIFFLQFIVLTLFIMFHQPFVTQPLDFRSQLHFPKLINSQLFKDIILPLYFPCGVSVRSILYLLSLYSILSLKKQFPCH